MKAIYYLEIYRGPVAKVSDVIKAIQRHKWITQVIHVREVEGVDYFEVYVNADKKSSIVRLKILIRRRIFEVGSKSVSIRLSYTDDSKYKVITGIEIPDKSKKYDLVTAIKRLEYQAILGVYTTLEGIPDIVIEMLVSSKDEVEQTLGLLKNKLPALTRVSTIILES